MPAALELVRGLTDEHEFDRHHGNIAQRLAPAQPAEAERVWQLLKQPIMRDGYAVRVCYAMAPGDLPRAAGIAAKITDPYTRAYALGQMALALSGATRRAPVSFSKKPWARLLRSPRRKRKRISTHRGEASTAATLLKVVERIDRDRVPEFLWRALALRGRRLEIERDEIGRLGTDAVIAMLVNPYDHAIAQALLEPILARLPRLIAGGDSYFPDPLFAAPAIVDPRRRSHWLRRCRLVRALAPAGMDETEAACRSPDRITGRRPPASHAADDRLLETRLIRSGRRRLTTPAGNYESSPQPWSTLTGSNRATQHGHTVKAQPPFEKRRVDAAEIGVMFQSSSSLQLRELRVRADQAAGSLAAHQKEGAAEP